MVDVLKKAVGLGLKLNILASNMTNKTEMEYLIELCGFEVVTIYDDYKLAPALNEEFPPLKASSS